MYKVCCLSSQMQRCPTMYQSKQLLKTILDPFQKKVPPDLAYQAATFETGCGQIVVLHSPYLHGIIFFIPLWLTLTAAVQTEVASLHSTPGRRASR